MKKQTKIAAVLSAAAFMAMVSGLPVYAASHGWVTDGDAKVYYCLLYTSDAADD